MRNGFAGGKQGKSQKNGGALLAEGLDATVASGFLHSLFEVPNAVAAGELFSEIFIKGAHEFLRWIHQRNLTVVSDSSDLVATHK